MMIDGYLCFSERKSSELVLASVFLRRMQSRGPSSVIYVLERNMLFMEFPRGAGGAGANLLSLSVPLAPRTESVC